MTAVTGTVLPVSVADRYVSSKAATDWALARSWLDGVLAGITYRDGWHFGIGYRSEIDGLLAEVRCGVEDRHDPHRGVTFRRSVDVTHAAHEQDLAGVLGVVHTVIREMENHERLEWFHYQGTNVYDPHPDGPSTPRLDTWPAQPGDVT